MPNNENNLTVPYPDALRLKDAGWVKETYFRYYVPNKTLDGFIIDRLAAPTFVEIWEELPKLLENKHHNNLYLELNECEIGYYHSGYSQGTFNYEFNNITKAACDMWIWLKGAKLI